MTAQLRRRGVAWGLALVGGVASGFVTTSSGCLFVDHCIVIITSGEDWCRPVVGALMWPAGSPDLAIPVLDDSNKPPIGCTCFNDAEVEILWAEVPPDKFAEFLGALEQAARDECDAIVPIGWDHNCYEQGGGPAGPEFKDPYPNGFGTCVGDCAYTNEPKGGCGDDPNPYECEELYGGGETGNQTSDGGDSADSTGDSDPNVQEPMSWRL